MDQYQPGVTGFHEVDEGPSSLASPPEGPSEDVAQSGLRLNPFIGVLWLIVAVLVIGGGTFLLNAPLSVSTADGAPMAYVLFSFAPQGLFVGLLTCIALMFWHAWQWQHRRG